MICNTTSPRKSGSGATSVSGEEAPNRVLGPFPPPYLPANLAYRRHLPTYLPIAGHLVPEPHDPGEIGICSLLCKLYCQPYTGQLRCHLRASIWCLEPGAWRIARIPCS